MNGHTEVSGYDLTIRPDEQVYGLIVIPQFKHINRHPDMQVVYLAYKKTICDKIVRLLTADFYAQKRYKHTELTYSLEFLQAVKHDLSEEVELELYEDQDSVTDPHDAMVLYNNEPTQVIHFISELIGMFVDAIIIPLWRLLMGAYLTGSWLEYATVGFTSPISLEVMLMKRAPAFIQEIYQ